MKSIFITLVLLLFCISEMKAQRGYLSGKSYYVNKNDSTSLLQNLDTKSQILFNQKLIELRKDIANDSLPSFFYNECLDDDFFSYCVPSLHKVRSLRKDLVNELNLEELFAIIKMTNGVKKIEIYSICSKDNEYLVFWNIPTYYFVCERIVQIQNIR